MSSPWTTGGSRSPRRRSSGSTHGSDRARLAGFEYQEVGGIAANRSPAGPGPRDRFVEGFVGQAEGAPVHRDQHRGPGIAATNERSVRRERFVGIHVYWTHEPA